MSLRRTPGRGGRVFVATLLLLAVSGLFAALWVQLQRGISTDARRAGIERQAVALLQAVNGLTADLVDARSAAVLGQTGSPVDLAASVTAVSGLDARLGAGLRTHQRWVDLRAGIERVQADHPVGRAASDRYTDLVVMATDLLHTLATAAQLSSDPSPSGQALVVAATETLPRIVTAAGRVADLNAIATPADPTDLVEVATAREEIATAAAELFTTALSSVDGDARPEFAPTIAGQLDALQAAIAPLAAPAARRQIAAVAPATLNADAGQVRQRARTLTRTVLGELDAVLADRAAELKRRQTVGVATAAAGAGLALVVLWWSASSPSLAAADDPLGPDPDVAAVSVQLPAVDARELLAQAELVPAGRAGRGRPPDRAGDAD